MARKSQYQSIANKREYAIHLVNEARNELSRRHFLNFVKTLRPDYQYGWFHTVLCNKLEKFFWQVKARKSPRLMIFAPPRIGKSENTSVLFPAWSFGKDPDLQIIGASHGASLASDFNRAIQRSIDSPEYSAIFPETQLFGKNIRTISQNTYLRNSDTFEIVGFNGKYHSAGVGGSITGKGAHIAIIDDPIKSAEDAYSETYRNSIWEWYLTTLRTRLMPGGGILLIMTRWHMDDLAGRIIKAMQEPGGEQWDILVFKAIAEEDEPPYRKKGEALHPERYPIEMLLPNMQSARVWQSMYQQSPIVRTGGLFEERWIEIVDELPKNIKSTVRYWDRAGSTKDSACRTAGVKAAQYGTKDFIILDSAIFKETPAKVRQAMRNIASQDGKNTRIVIEQEPGSSGIESIDLAKQEMSGYSTRGDAKKVSKEVNAEILSELFESGRIKLLRGAWNREFISELIACPYGEYWDQIDAAGGAIRFLQDKPIARVTMLDY